MKCLETRTRADGIRTRRYELDDGRRVTMCEVPATVLKALGMGKVQEAMETWRRGEVQRAESHARRQRIVELLEQGIKPTAIAHEVGVTDQRVRQIRKELEHERKRIKPAPIQHRPRRVEQEVGRDLRARPQGGHPSDALRTVWRPIG
jgi:protein-disulfide isomerase-like protein with CxxC motif